MLFDLTGRRKRLIQVIYATLAVLMGGGLVLFGIGSDATGGLFDALGLRDGGGQQGSGQFIDRAQRIERQLATRPKDEQLLLELARTRYLAGNTELEGDASTGQQVITEKAEAQYQEAVTAWEKYLDLKPKRPNTNTAPLIVQAYVGINDPEGAAEAQRIVAEAEASQGSLSNLALYEYFAFDFKAGDAAAAEAVKLANSAQKSLVRSRLASFKKEAKKAEEEEKRQAKGATGGENPLLDPLGGLGGASP
jgi:hypothetical protein